MDETAPEKRAKKRKRRGTAARIAAAAFAAAALASLAAAGLRMHRAFLGRETVAEAQNWIFARIPRGEALAFDEYLGPVSRGVPCEPIFVQRLPEFWPGTRRGQAPDVAPGSIAFYFRNASFPGRLGNRHPASRALLPPFASNETAFARENVLVAAWKPSGRGVRPVFAQHDVELWAMRGPGGDASPWRPAPPADAPRIDLACPRPVSLVETGHAFRGAVLADAPLGAIDGLQVVGKRRSMQPPPDAAFAVFFHAAGTGPATICAEGRILSVKTRLDPGASAVLPLDRRALARASRTDPFPSFRVRMRGDDQTSLCIGFFARNAAEARRLLLEAGAKLPPPPGAGAPEEAGGPPRSAPADPSAAEAAVAAWRAGTGPEPVFACGLPLSLADALARLRLPPFVPAPGRRLPAWLPPGTWTVDVAFPEDLAPPDGATTLFAGQISPLRPVPAPPGAASGGSRVYAAEIRTGRGCRLEIDGAFEPGPALLAAGLSGAEIHWSPLRPRFW